MNPDFSRNHFQLLGLPTAFEIDVARLEQGYRDLQVQVHPDRFASAGDAERRLSMQWATRANEAYQTLKDPLGRARYLLELNGVDVAEHSNTAMPAAFLMRQMEWREAIEEALDARDLDGLEKLSRELRREAGGLQAELADLIDRRHDFDTAAQKVRMLKFMDRLREDINHALEALEN